MENEKLWKEEHEIAKTDLAAGQDLRTVGITPAGMESDIDMGNELSDTELGSAEADTGAGPAAAPQTAPGAGSVGSPAGQTAGA